MTGPTPSSQPPLGYGRQWIDESDERAVLDALRSERLTQGPRVGAFEAALRDATGAPFAACVSTGTAALHAALLALDLGPGSTVATTANTFLASATMAAATGAEVRFVDIDLETGNLDLDELDELCARERVDCVVPVHFAGLAVDLDRLLALRERHGFRVVADGCHALGGLARSGGELRPVGAHAGIDATVLSFHPVKQVTSGEGGAVLTHDAALDRRVRRIADSGLDRASERRPFDDADGGAPWFAPMEELGFNYRMSELHAALGASQIARLDAFLARRRELATRYAEGLEAPLIGPAVADGHAWHLFVIRVPDGRDALMAHLAARGVGTQLHYYPVPLQPWWRGRTPERDYPRAVEHARTALSLPLFPAMSDADQERVLAALAAWEGA